MDNKGAHIPPPYPAAAPYPQQQPQYLDQMQAPAHRPPMAQPQPHAMHSGSTVVVTQPGVVMGNSNLGPNATTTKCMYCHATITTNIERTCGGFLWLMIGVICLIGCVTGGITWLGCCLIPLCIPSCYDTRHSCPNCGRVLCTHSRL